MGWRLASLLVTGVIFTSSEMMKFVEPSNEYLLLRCQEMCDGIFGIYSDCLREYPIYQEAQFKKGLGFESRFNDSCNFTLQSKIGECKSICLDEYGFRNGI